MDTTKLGLPERLRQRVFLLNCAAALGALATNSLSKESAQGYERF